MDECSRLLSGRAARHRGFESRPIRQTMRKARTADECACLENRRAAEAPRVRIPRLPPPNQRHNRTKERAMTLLDLGRIASHLDTGMAHAMLHAVAVAKDRGSRCGWATA